MCPPGKTEEANRAIAMMIAENPKLRVLVVTFRVALATKMCHELNAILDSDEFLTAAASARGLTKEVGRWLFWIVLALVLAGLDWI
jgi:hypothetical protein